MAEAATITVTQKKSMLKAAESKFRDDVNELANRKHEMTKVDLVWKYDLGIVARTMADEEGKELHEKTYGAHVVEDIIKYLGEEKTLVYAAIKFSRLFKKSEVKKLADLWPWRAMLYLVKIEDPDDRAKFQLAWEKGKFKNSDEFIEAVKEYKGEQDPKKTKKDDDKGVPSGLSRPIKTATTVLTKVNGELLPDLLVRLREFAKRDKTPDDKLEEVAEALHEQLPIAKQLVVDVEKALKAAGI